MKIDEIIESWKQDSVIDDVDLDREALKIPNLHAKYLRLLFEQRVKLRSLQGKRKELKRVLGEYYRGDLNNPEDLTEINREPWGKTVLKNELNDSHTLAHYVSSGLIYNEDIVLVSIHLHTSLLGKYIDTFFTQIKYYCVNSFTNRDYFNVFSEKSNHNYLFYWKN